MNERRTGVAGRGARALKDKVLEDLVWWTVSRVCVCDSAAGRGVGPHPNPFSEFRNLTLTLAPCYPIRPASTATAPPRAEPSHERASLPPAALQRAWLPTAPSLEVEHRADQHTTGESTADGDVRVPAAPRLVARVLLVDDLGVGVRVRVRVRVLLVDDLGLGLGLGLFGRGLGLGFGFGCGFGFGLGFGLGLGLGFRRPAAAVGT